MSEDRHLGHVRSPRNFAATQIFSSAGEQYGVWPNNRFAWSQDGEGFVNMAPGAIFTKPSQLCGEANLLLGSR
jgi:hypothetical protein